MPPKTEASGLRSHIGYHMRVVSNAVSHTFAKRLSTHAITVAEWVILREMYMRGETTSPSTIAELTGLTRGAISKLIDRLVKKALVTRTESSEDRRAQKITLTTGARKLVPKLANIADENDEGFFSVLSRGERKILTDLLIRLAEAHHLTTHPIE